MLFDILSSAIYAEHAENLKDGNQLAISVVEAKDRPFGRKRSFKVHVLLYLNSRTVDFEGAGERVMAHLAGLAGEGGLTVSADWLITGEGAGIYLFEELSRKQYGAYRGMRNTICTMDTDNGKTFFELGTPANDRVSLLFEGLFAEASGLTAEEFRRAFRDNFGKLAALMDRKRGGLTGRGSRPRMGRGRASPP